MPTPLGNVKAPRQFLFPLGVDSQSTVPYRCLAINRLEEPVQMPAQSQRDLVLASLLLKPAGKAPWQTSTGKQR